MVSTSWKVSLAVLPSSALTCSGIVDAGQLDEDAVLALALDRRLLGAGLVDAAADDLDRLLDRLAAPRLGRLRAELHLAGAVGRRYRPSVFGSILPSAGFGRLDLVGVAMVKTIASPSTLSPV